MKKKTPESKLLAEVCDFLSDRGYTFWRQNNSPIFDVRSKSFRAMPKHSMKGLSDIVVLNDGKAYFIELKSDVGKQSEDQKIFEQIVTSAGSDYLLVRRLNDLINKGF